LTGLIPNIDGIRVVSDVALFTTFSVPFSELAATDDPSIVEI
jgi:hypothetical protein